MGFSSDQHACVCMCERERGGERERKRQRQPVQLEVLKQLILFYESRKSSYNKKGEVNTMIISKTTWCKREDVKQNRH